MSTADQKEYQRSYYLANRERVLARTKETNRRRRSNPDVAEKAREYNRAYHQKNRETIKRRKASYRQANVETERAKGRQYHQQHSDARNLKSRKWHHENKEAAKIRNKEWSVKNKARRAEQASRRLALKLSATPSWANLIAIRAFYDEAARLTAETGVIHHVDHIVPLKGKNVCGLHCEANLQVVTRAVNIAKGNRFPSYGVVIKGADDMRKVLIACALQQN